MKNLLLALFTTTLLVIGSCEKEPLPMPNPNYIVTADEQPTALVTELETNLNDGEVTDLNLGDVKITDYPAFIDYDPFTVVVTRTNSADSCLKGLEVTKAEKEQLARVFKNKIECQRYNKVIITKVHREIEAWAKTQKENYYKNWYLVERGKIEYDFKMGVITQLQYKEKIATLEKTWANKMMYLNGQVKEKMKASTEKLAATSRIIGFLD